MHSGHLQPTCHFNAMLGLGIVLIFCTIANLALGIANAVVCGFMGAIGYGIWGGIICFIAGIYGIVASCLRSRSCVVGFMVLALIAAVSATVQLAMGSGSAVVDHWMLKTHRGESVLYGNDNRGAMRFYVNKWFLDRRCAESEWMNTTGPVATDALLACFAAIQGIIAMIAAIVCCRNTVCPKGVTSMPWSQFENQVSIVVPK